MMAFWEKCGEADVGTFVSQQDSSSIVYKHLLNSLNQDLNTRRTHRVPSNRRPMQSESFFSSSMLLSSRGMLEIVAIVPLRH
jgi:hypothetical protein